MFATVRLINTFIIVELPCRMYRGWVRRTLQLYFPGKFQVNNTVLTTTLTTLSSRVDSLVNIPVNFMCMGILSASIYVYHVHVWCFQRPVKGIGSSESGVTDVCELWCWWESNPDPLEGQPLLLTTEPSLLSWFVF